MTRHCISYGCVNRSDKPECTELSWHSLPMKNKKLLRLWLKNMRRENTPVTKNSYLCSFHFAKECFHKAIGGTRVYLKPGSVPTIFNFSEAKHTRIRKAPLDRSKTKSSVKSTAKRSANVVVDLHESQDPSAYEKTINKDTCTTDTNVVNILDDELQYTIDNDRIELQQQTENELTGSNYEHLQSGQLQGMEIEGERVKELFEHRIAQLEVKLKQERTVKKTLEQKLSNNTFCVDNIKNNAKLFKFYSGFENYDVFSMVLNFLGREAASKLNYNNRDLNRMDCTLKPGPQRTLSVENEFFSIFVSL